MAHFCEHMLFAGTKTLDRAAIEKRLDDTGANYTAGTWYDHTVLTASLMPCEMDTTLATFADMIVDGRITGAEVRRERSIIIEEILQTGQSAAGRLRPIAFAGHRLGGRIAGAHEDIRTIRTADLRRFRQRTYRPENLVVSVCGDVDAEAVHAAVAKAFGRDFDCGVAPEVRFAPIPPAYVGGDDRSALCDDTSGEVAIGLPGFGEDTHGDLALSLFAHAMAGGLGSRLYRALRAERGLVYGVDAFTDVTADAGLFVMCLEGAGHKLAEAAKVAIDCLAEAADGIDEAELRRAKARMTMQLARDMADIDARTHWAARNVCRMGAIKDFDEMRRDIEMIRREDIAAITRAMIENMPSIVVAGDGKHVLDAAAAARRLH